MVEKLDTHVNGNGSGYWSKVSKQSFGLGVAEITSITVSLGVVAFADKLFGKPLEEASHVIAKLVFEPYLDSIEGVLGKICQLEECKIDKTKMNREERAQMLAKASVVFGASWVAAMAAKVMTRQLFDRMTGVRPNTEKITTWAGRFDQLQFWKHMTKGDALILAADEGVHYGSLILMGTGAAKHADYMIRATTNVLEKCGVPKDKAHELSTYGYVWELPNLLGFGAGVGGIMLANKLGLNHGHGHISTPA